MLSFLRARRSPSPEAGRDRQWDGAVLTIPVEHDDVALDLDGVFFTAERRRPDGTARFAFPFAPADAPIEALPRKGRDGTPLAVHPFVLRFGERESEPSRFVPFGVDCAAREVAIVIPVYDAPAAVKRCLDSVLQHTTGHARLIVIDDASPDAAIAPLLARYEGRANIEVLRNATNRGFTATANRGIAEAGSADVVLLNADTEVGPNWLTGLRRAAYCADDVATATAVSDNAGAFSVPELERENALPACWSFADTARAVWQSAGLAYPELPTGNGFCLYIRRSVIDAIGAFDEAAFPQGYGEENDFCQRASAKGLRHLIAGNVLVRHERSRSFGHERRARLGEAGMAVLRARWPRYEADVAATLYSYERRVLDWRVRRLFSGATVANRPRERVLYLDDVATAAQHERWHLIRRDDTVDLMRDGTLVVSHSKIDPGSFEQRIGEWLQRYAIEAIASRAEVPTPLAQAARRLGVPIARDTGQPR